MNKLLAIIYAVLLLAGPKLNTFILPFGPFDIAGGMLTACFAYGIVDVVANARGRAFVLKMVKSGVVIRLAVYVALAAWTHTSTTMIQALTISMFLSQAAVSVPLFLWLKRKMSTGFWARYGLSSLPTQTLALFIWVPLVYWGKNPLPLLAGGFALRVLMAWALTPLFSFLARHADESRTA